MKYTKDLKERHTLRMSKKMKIDIERYCKDKNISLGYLIRNLLDEKLKNK